MQKKRYQQDSVSFQSVKKVANRQNVRKQFYSAPKAFPLGGRWQKSLIFDG